MADVFNILRAMVADGTELTIVRAEFGLKLTALKKASDGAPTTATRLLRLSDDNDALCTALVEIYLQLRNVASEMPAIPCLVRSPLAGS